MLSQRALFSDIGFKNYNSNKIDNNTKGYRFIYLNTNGKIKMTPEVQYVSDKLYRNRQRTQYNMGNKTIIYFLEKSPK